MPPRADTVSYFCTEGELTAVFGADVVHLMVPRGREVVLPQTISGSGIRYSSPAGDTVFSGKGANATLEENGRTTFSNCLAGTERPLAGDSLSFIDASHTFRITFPRAFTLSGGDVGYTRSWRSNATTLGLVLAVVTAPRTLMPKTNFAGARITVGVSADSSAVARCTAPANGETAAGTTTINGQPFTTLTGADAGAGNYYELTSYRTVRGGECYALEYVIHSTNIGNYSPDQGIRPFDKPAIHGVLERVVRSFTFLSSSSVAPGKR